MVEEELVGTLDLVQQWVDSGGEFDHNLIVLELLGREGRH